MIQGVTWCYMHDTFELSSGAYIVCGECQHVYQSPRALRKAWRRTGREIDGWRRWLHPIHLMTPARRIFFCQECLHDW